MRLLGEYSQLRVKGDTYYNGTLLTRATGYDLDTIQLLQLDKEGLLEVKTQGNYFFDCGEKGQFLHTALTLPIDSV